MRRWFAPLLLLASAQASPDPLTLTEARALAPDALAHRVLGASGVLVREASVQGWSEHLGDGDDIAGATFATAPRAGQPGLCAADLYQVVFAPRSSSDKRAGQVIDLSRETVYRMVDAGPVPTGFSAGYAERSEAACAKATPVLATSGTPTYFYSHYDERPDVNGASALFVTRLLKRLDSPTPVPRCASWIPQAISVADCRRLLASFAAGPLFMVDVKPCAAPSRNWCAELRDHDGLNWIQVTVTMDRPADLSRPAAIRGISLENVRAVE